MEYVHAVRALQSNNALSDWLFDPQRTARVYYMQNLAVTEPVPLFTDDDVTEREEIMDTRTAKDVLNGETTHEIWRVLPNRERGYITNLFVVQDDAPLPSKEEKQSKQKNKKKATQKKTVSLTTAPEVADTSCDAVLTKVSVTPNVVLVYCSKTCVVETLPNFDHLSNKVHASDDDEVRNWMASIDFPDKADQLIKLGVNNLNFRKAAAAKPLNLNGKFTFKVYENETGELLAELLAVEDLGDLVPVITAIDYSGVFTFDTADASFWKHPHHGNGTSMRIYNDSGAYQRKTGTFSPTSFSGCLESNNANLKQTTN